MYFETSSDNILSAVPSKLVSISIVLFTAISFPVLLTYVPSNSTLAVFAKSLTLKLEPAFILIGISSIAASPFPI